MYIAHLSDLHISSRCRPQNAKKMRHLIENALVLGVSHFIITGDLVHDPDKNDFLTLRSVLRDAGILDPAKLTITIGNHDIFGGVHLAEEVLTFPSKCLATDYERKTYEFRNYFLEAYESAEFPCGDGDAVFVKRLKDVVLIGLDSCCRYSRLRNLFASRGEIDKKQAECLRNVVSREEIAPLKKIVLMHHHFQQPLRRTFEKKSMLVTKVETSGHKLKNERRVLALFRRCGIDLVLHGHWHDSYIYTINGIQFSCAGGTVEKNEEGTLRVNLILMREEGAEIKIATLRESSATHPLQSPMYA